MGMHIMIFFGIKKYMYQNYWCVEAMNEGVDNITYVLLGCLTLLTLIYQLGIIVS
jgi:hypothetical protein